MSQGAQIDAKLNVKGENLGNVVSARDFVGFYNGHPDHNDLKVNLDVEDASIVGIGNVALDVARILLTDVDVLAKTDVSEAALEALKASRVKRVTLIGRRGPLNVAFTIKELREMVKLPQVGRILHPDGFEGLEEAISGLKRPKKRLIELLYKAFKDQDATKAKRWELKLLRSPLEFRSDDSKNVSGVKLSVNRLNSASVLETTPETETMKTQLVFTSVGYKGRRIEGVPFNDDTCTVECDASGRIAPGFYCAGWASPPGPRGVIVDTMNGAFAVAKTISDDLDNGVIKAKGKTDSDLEIDLSKAVSHDGWRKIDAVEVERGAKVGKPREKITNVDEMLRLIK